MPSVVVGADHPMIIEVMEKWANSKKVDEFGKGYTDELARELKEHTIQIVMLEEILSQLEAFRQYVLALKKSAEEQVQKATTMEKELSEMVSSLGIYEKLPEQYKSLADQGNRALRDMTGEKVEFQNMTADFDGILKVYDRTLLIVKKVIAKKKFTENKVVSAMQDGVYQAIQENLGEKFQVKPNEWGRLKSDELLENKKRVGVNQK